MRLEEVKKLDDSYHIPAYGRLPVDFVKGSGVRLWDSDGKAYLDFLSGLGVVNIGHCHPKVTEAIARQAAELVHVSNLFYTEPQALLAERLSGLALGGKVFFANSGAEANEGAIKLARRYNKTAFDPERVGIVTAYRSFHGRTMKTLAATGQRDKQEPFDPMPPGFTHVPLNDLEALEAAILPTTGAVMLEVIQGEGGVHPCTAEYLAGVRSICDENKMLLILDEVQTGVGRTGDFFAFERHGVRPDILTMAKALANGLPIGVVAASDAAAGAFKPGDHGSTFGGGPVVCSAALAVLEVIEEEGLLKATRESGAYLRDGLERLAALKESVVEVRGEGLMLAIQLDAGAKELARKALADGFVVNAIGEEILRFLPPLVVEREHIDSLLQFLDGAISS